VLAAQMQVEEGSYARALGCDRLAWLDGADEPGDEVPGDYAGTDLGGQQLAEELFKVGEGEMLGVPQGEEQPPPPPRPAQNPARVGSSRASCPCLVMSMKGRRPSRRARFSASFGFSERFPSSMVPSRSIPA
jgi:hypothetical protein